MDEKVLEYLLKSMSATDICIGNTQTVMDALRKQKMINKIQRAVNGVLILLTVGCVGSIRDLVKIVNAHNKKIAELEAKCDGEVNKKRKGE